MNIFSSMTFYRCYHELVDRYRLTVSQIAWDMYPQKLSFPVSLTSITIFTWHWPLPRVNRRVGTCGAKIAYRFGISDFTRGTWCASIIFCGCLFSSLFIFWWGVCLSLFRYLLLFFRHTVGHNRFTKNSNAQNE